MTTYVSTRGLAAERGFEAVLLAGLAEDGGLFVPRDWPRLSPTTCAPCAACPTPRPRHASCSLRRGCFDRDELRALCEDAYGEGFGHPATAPLKQLGPDDWLLELFHGPTLAFKDFAMRLLARMFDRVLAAAAGRSPSSAPPRATPGPRPCAPSPAWPTSASPCSTRTAASPPSSAGR
jgi:threonine synthase